MNAPTEIQKSIAALTEYWLDKKDLQEEIGFDEETGDTIFSYDGYFSKSS